MRRFLIAACVILLIGTPQFTSQASEPAKKDCTTETIPTGKNAIYAWSENLVGKACRTWTGDANSVRVELDVKRGGYDCGVAFSESPRLLTKLFHTRPHQFNLDVNLTGKGSWWSGPKTCICKTQDWQGLEGNWECYIIENASKSPDELMAMMGAKYHGQTEVDGDVYRHYTKPWMQWQQVISIRGEYRSEGPVNYGPILRYWHEKVGVPNWYVHSPKVSMETTGDMHGYWEWTGIDTPSIQTQARKKR